MNIIQQDGMWLLHAKDLAEVLGVTARWVRQLTSAGYLKKVDGKHYELRNSVQSYASFLKENKGGSEKKDLDYERMLYTQTKRKIEETKLEIIRGDVHRSEDVKLVMNNMLVRFKGKLKSMPMRVAPRVIGIDNLPQIQDLIDEAVNECLQELSEYDPYEFYEQSAHRIVLGDDEDEEDGEDE